ncbi:GAF domain-containing protein [Streptomyces sp. TS71-3]|uniref:GAF domain-containing protein n=1 Tax=Streptomyces sp. TS71-3 TaxID=2733862 RepID=UPI001BB37896|nr:GAF domain-containing protein [Streptomyces sp. TS71-3]
MSLTPDHSAQSAEERTHRLQVLGLNGVGADATFDRVAGLAASLTGSPLALVNLISTERQMYRGLYVPPQGEERVETGDGVVFDLSDMAREGPADAGFCPHVVAENALLALDDVFDYPRFKGNPVVNTLGVRSYLGTPLRDHTGAVLGTLCVLDTKPRKWDQGRKDGLMELSQTLLSEFKLRDSILTQQQQLFAIFDRAPFPIMLTEGPEHLLRYANSTQGDAFGLVPRLSRGRDSLSGLDSVGVFRTMDQAFHTGQTITLPEAQLIPYNSSSPKTYSFTCTPVKLSPRTSVISGVLTVAMDITGDPSGGQESRHIAAQFGDRFDQIGSGAGGHL